MAIFTILRLCLSVEGVIKDFFRSTIRAYICTPQEAEIIQQPKS